jgi:hypothetical protein
MMACRIFLVLILVSAVVRCSAASPEIIDVGEQRQLFIDDLFFAQVRGVSLRVHSPRKTGDRTITQDRPWERGGLGPYSSVLWDNGRYHFWYHAMDNKLWHASPVAGAICYATSEDGITWQKPDLGLIEYEGSRRNNIVVGHGAGGLRVGQDGMMVFVDPNAPAGERLRMVNRFNAPGEGRRDAVDVMSSGDGIHWKLTHEAVLTYRPEEKGHHLDSQNVVFWDEGLKRYVAYVRRNLKTAGSQGRAIARAESDKLGGFPPAQDMPVVFLPDPPDALHRGASVVDYYSSAALRYPWADRAYFQFPQAYYHYTRSLREFAQDLPTNAGPMDTQFAASRDGMKWERYDRQPFVSLGMKGEFDCHSVRLIYGLVPDRVGREMYLYYRGSDWLHGWDRDERNRNLLTSRGLGAHQDITGISRLVLRRDGFVSATAGQETGQFSTPPLKFTGRRLRLNVDTSATGIARVACLDAEGRILPGYSLEDCDIIHTANEINRTVAWRGSPELPATDGVVRLRIEMRNTDLYAFQFSPE